MWSFRVRMWSFRVVSKWKVLFEHNCLKPQLQPKSLRQIFLLLSFCRLRDPELQLLHRDGLLDDETTTLGETWMSFFLFSEAAIFSFPRHQVCLFRRFYCTTWSMQQLDILKKAWFIQVSPSLPVAGSCVGPPLQLQLASLSLRVVLAVQIWSLQSKNINKIYLNILNIFHLYLIDLFTPNFQYKKWTRPE